MRKYVSVNNLEIAGFSGASFDKRTYLFPRVIIEEDILQAVPLMFLKNDRNSFRHFYC